jgi:hypothetical protein
VSTREVVVKVTVVVSEGTAGEIVMYRVACALDELDVPGYVRSVVLE